MTKEAVFSTWAPEASAWSRWVKPVLFAYLESAPSQVPLSEVAGDVAWAPPSHEKVALVLDLPGADGVVTGLALAERGYRPIPLYNAVPLPSGELLLDQFTGRGVAAVNVLPIISALRKAAEQLAQLNLPAAAPPAFLLDSNRAGTGRRIEAGEFDNRSISFTTDFPSANFLAAHGIQRVILVQRNRVEPQSDLAHSLRRWQDGGLVLERKRLDSPEAPQPFAVTRPSWYSAMFQRVLSGLGLRRAAAGGFGGWIPESSAGG